MAPEPHPVEEATRGETVEAMLWSTVTRLRARGWHISLWEIQRAQDVIRLAARMIEHAAAAAVRDRHRSG